MASYSNPNSLNSIKNSNSNVRVYDKDDETQVDRISDLPDSLLCHILSFLPTKEAVTASFLSTRWLKILWSSPNLKLDFDDDQIDKTKFVDFVSGVMSNCVSMDSALRALRYSCKEPHGVWIIDPWIYEAARLNVQSLDLKFRIRDFIPFPDSIGACTRLTTLKLGEFTVVFPDYFRMPNLKVLNLTYMGLAYEPPIADFSNAFPVLEELIMVNCDVYSRIIEICVPTLKRLRMKHCTSKNIGEYVYENYTNYEIVLNTPALEELYYYDWNAASRYIVSELTCLNIAHLDVRPSMEQEDKEPTIDFYSSVAELIMACSKTKYLRLPEPAVLGFDCSHRVSSLFLNLKTLELGFLCPRSWWSLLQLLDSAPNLCSLCIELGIRGYERCAICEPAFDNMVPDCFTSSFQKCSILNFSGAVQEFSFVEFFLNHANSLQKMVISFGSKVKVEKRLHIKENLLALPCCSNTCQVVFSKQVRRGNKV